MLSKKAYRINLPPFTPFNYDDKTSIIDHINEEHLDELQNFLRVFKNVSQEDINACETKLFEIYAEGIAIVLDPMAIPESKSKSKSKNSQYGSANASDFNRDDSLYMTTHFIKFKTPISNLADVQMQYVLLKQQADKKIGKKSIQIKEQPFTVKHSYKVSKNMLRLVLTPYFDKPQTEGNSPNMLHHEAGYAYLFDLTTPTQSHTPAREHCYYTLRKGMNVDSNHEIKAIEAWIDVFIHGDTSGGNWATALKAGDDVKSKREFPEKIEHLQSGQALLIADETSMPTVARLLETWRNPIPPFIICITEDAADQAYFDDVAFSDSIVDSVTVLPLVIGNGNPKDSIKGVALAHLIDRYLGDYLAYNPLTIDKVWGALEASTVKALRPLLRDRFELERSDVVIKVYWRQD